PARRGQSRPRLQARPRAAPRRVLPAGPPSAAAVRAAPHRARQTRNPLRHSLRHPPPLPSSSAPRDAIDSSAARVPWPRRPPPGRPRPPRPTTPPAPESLGRRAARATAPTARGYGPVDLVRACVALPGRLSGRDRQLTHPCRKDTEVARQLAEIVRRVRIIVTPCYPDQSSRRRFVRHGRAPA